MPACRIQTGVSDIQVAEEAYNKLVKKFSAYPDSWTKFAEFYLKKGDIDSARALLPRSLKSLDKSKRRSQVTSTCCGAPRLTP